MRQRRGEGRCRRVVVRAVVAAAVVVAAGCRRAPRIAGAWEVMDRDPGHNSYVFREDGTGTHLAGGRVQEFRYTIDYGSDPIPLDMQIAAPGGGALAVHAIVRFRDDKGMEMKTAEGAAPRPAGFSRAEPGVRLRHIGR
jgi:hypothetical protein